MRSSRAIIAPSGKPLAMPLPAVTMSGATPSCSIAHIVPLRPMPDCTSSQTSRMPWRSQSSRRYVNQPSGGSSYPPSPSHDSTTIAATSVGETMRVKSTCSR